MVDLHLPLSRAKAATTAGNKEIQLYIMFGGWVEAKKMFFKAPTKSLSLLAIKFVDLMLRAKKQAKSNKPPPSQVPTFLQILARL